MFYTNPFTSRPILHNQTPKIIIDFSPFKYSLKIFAAPLFTYNVLLIFNFKRFPPFLYSDLRKSRRCNFILLQTSQCDISSTGNNSDLNIIPKGIFSKYFKYLWNAVSVLNIMKCRDKQAIHRPYCRVLILTRRNRDISSIYVTCLNQ